MYFFTPIHRKSKKQKDFRLVLEIKISPGNTIISEIKKSQEKQLGQCRP